MPSAKGGLMGKRRSEARYTFSVSKYKKLAKKMQEKSQKESSCVQLNDEKQRKDAGPLSQGRQQHQQQDPRSAIKYNETYGSSNDDDCTGASRTLTAPAHSAAVAGTAAGICQS